MRRISWLVMLLGACWASWLLAGCSGSCNLSSGATDGTATPSFRVNLTRAGVSYTPVQIRHAYGFDQLSGNGVGQTIALVEAYGSPTIQHDLNTFCTQFNLPATTVTLAYPNGKPFTSDSGWALETSLDVEWAHAIAPGAQILLVVAQTNSLTALLNGVNYAAKHAAQVSMSWTVGEFNGEQVYNSYFTMPGVSFFAASGDSGAGVNWPAVAPNVIGVGGTTLQLDASGDRESETGWSGSGGGQSRYLAEPSWQRAWQSSGYRQTPDVAYDADPNTGVQVYDSTPYDRISGWFIIGGTSAGTPQWAALSALVNANRTADIADMNAALYDLGSPATLTNNFYDITSGSNGPYTAKPGYDLVTGLGTPLATTLQPHLVTQP